MASHGLTEEDQRMIPPLIAGIICRRLSLIPRLDITKLANSPVEAEVRDKIKALYKVAPEVLRGTNTPTFGFVYDDNSIAEVALNLPKAYALPYEFKQNPHLHSGIKILKPAPGFEHDFNAGVDILRQIVKVYRDAAAVRTVVLEVLKACTTTAQVRHHWPRLCELVATRAPADSTARKRFGDTGKSRAQVSRVSAPIAAAVKMIPSVDIALTKCLMLPKDAKFPDGTWLAQGVTPRRFSMILKPGGNYTPISNPFHTGLT